MWLRTAFGAGSSLIFLIACGGDGVSPSTSQGSETATETATETSPTEPVSGDNAEDEAPKPKEPAVMTASPSCAPVGSRVVLKLGRTRDHRSVDCYDVDVVSVRFAPGKDAKITVMGPMSDGYCAIDVEVPKGAESGKITVSVGDDAFETASPFPVPCP